MSYRGSVVSDLPGRGSLVSTAQEINREFPWMRWVIPLAHEGILPLCTAWTVATSRDVSRWNWAPLRLEPARVRVLVQHGALAGTYSFSVLTKR
jgi:hypothetical protein